MRTMVLQYVVSLLMLAFGVAGLLASRRSLHSLPHRIAWTMTGAAFALAAAIKLVQNVYGTVALVAGPGSTTWNEYLGWAPLFDHSRTGITTTLFLLLIVLLLPQRSWAAVGRSGFPWYGWGLALLAGGALGAAAGWVQGWNQLRHFGNVTFADAAELLLVLATVFALLLRERVDRLLWTVLSLYGLNLALNVLWFSAWVQTSQVSAALSPVYMNLGRITVYLIMIGVVLRRLVLARRGTAVPGLLSSVPFRATRTRRMF